MIGVIIKELRTEKEIFRSALAKARPFFFSAKKFCFAVILLNRGVYIDTVQRKTEKGETKCL